jgi:hypothetical protein
MTLVVMEAMVTKTTTTTTMMMMTTTKSECVRTNATKTGLQSVWLVVMLDAQLSVLLVWAMS